MSTKTWAVLGLAATGLLAGCSDDNDKDLINLPIPVSADAYVLVKDGSSYALSRFHTVSGGTDSGAAQAIGGLPAGEELLGMDFRPRDSKLYLVGRNGVADGSLGAVYVINELPASGALTATLVSELVATPDDTLPFTGFADGASYGVDFNPFANALRIVSSAGENLRIPFGGVGPIPAQLTVTTDTKLTQNAVAKTGVVAAGYTNNLDLTPSTTLLVMSGAELYTQAPPNDGVLTAVGTLSLGGAPVTTTGPLNFDIFTTEVDNRGFFLAEGIGDGDVAFGTVDLASGALTILVEGDADSDEDFVGLAMKASTP